jgi:hypothetical protein
MTHQRSTATCQRRQALSERGIEPLDVGRVDHPVTLREVLLFRVPPWPQLQAQAL